MKYSIVLPELMGSAEATIVRWLKAEGDVVRRGDPLVEVETDKATIEVEAPESGLLESIMVEEGSTIGTGSVIAFLMLEAGVPVGTEAGPESPVASARPVGRDKAMRDEKALPTGDAAAQGIAAARPARRLASEHGIDLRQIVGSGAGGRIELHDVEEHLQRNEGKHASGSSRPLSGAQRAAAKRLEAAWRVPQFAMRSSVNAANLVASKLHFSEGAIKPTYTDFFVRAAALALDKVPRANVRWVEGLIVDLDSIDIGVAVAVGRELDELYVPVIRNALSLSMQEISVERQRIVEAARTKKVRPSDLGGASLTISNLGMYPVDALFPVLNAPEALIIGVGRVALVPPNETRDPTIEVVLVADHRAMGGAVAAKFLEKLIAALESA